MQMDAPSFAENVPGRHDEHTGFPEPRAKKPFVQFVQLALPELLYFPGSQVVHERRLTSEVYEPAGHERHTVLVVIYFPTGHEHDPTVSPSAQSVAETNARDATSSNARNMATRAHAEEARFCLYTQTHKSRNSTPNSLPATLCMPTIGHRFGFRSISRA